MRYNDEIAALTRKLRAAAFSLRAAGGSEDEVLAAVQAGLDEFDASRARTAQARVALASLLTDSDGPSKVDADEAAGPDSTVARGMPAGGLSYTARHAA